MTEMGDGIGNMFGALGHRKAGKKKARAGKAYQWQMNALGDWYWKQFMGTDALDGPPGKLKLYKELYGWDQDDPSIFGSYDSWIGPGAEAQNSMSDLVLGKYGGDLYDNPIFKNLIDTSERTVNRNALATGVYGGNRSKALVDNALETNQNWLANLNALSTTGLNALNTRNSLWENFAAGSANLKAGGAAGAMEATFAASNELAAGMAQGGQAIEQGAKQLIMAAGSMGGGGGGGGMSGMMSSFGMGGGS